MWVLRRGSKYGAKKSTFKGEVYHSKKEAGYARDLDLLKKAGEIKDYQRQVRFSIDFGRYHICNYYADFVVEMNDGSKEIHECKGFQTEVFRLKWKLMEVIYSKDYKLVMIT